MQAADRKRFATAIVAAGEYYGKQPSPQVVELYWRGLEQYDIQAVERAIAAHMQNPDQGQFMPKIADLVRVIGGRSEDRSMLAWSEVDRTVRTVGRYQSIVFEDRLIHRVIADMGGWVKLCSHDEADWPFVAKEFGARYRGLLLAGGTPHRGLPLEGGASGGPDRLIGLAEQHNGIKGFQVAEPVRIGRREFRQLQDQRA